MVEKAQEWFGRWWTIVAVISSLIVALVGVGVVWGASMGKLSSVADSVTSVVISNGALAAKIDRISSELNDAKLAALMAKVQADHTQAQMDTMSQSFLALQQKLIFNNPPVRLERQ